MNSFLLETKHDFHLPFTLIKIEVLRFTFNYKIRVVYSTLNNTLSAVPSHVPRGVKYDDVQL